jgi:hypothetical protein
VRQHQDVAGFDILSDDRQHSLSAGGAETLEVQGDVTAFLELGGTGKCAGVFLGHDSLR